LQYTSTGSASLNLNATAISNFYVPFIGWGIPL
jgi:hypothetical protein